jgi:hypothetical protein
VFKFEVMKIFVSIVSMTFIAATFCACDESDPDSGPPVYLVGAVDGQAAFWKDGVLTKQATPTGLNSIGTCLAFSASDVYVGGIIIGTSRKPSYWKNGVLVELPLPDFETETTRGPSRSWVATFGADVYVLTMSCGGTDPCEGTVWKNDAIIGTAGQYVGDLSGMGVTSTGDVIVLGIGTFESSPTVWRNGVAAVLDGLDANAWGLHIDGNDVYVAGEVSRGQILDPCYWKNGTRVDLDGGLHGASGFGIFVTVSDVYIAGRKFEGQGSTAMVWKNGVPMTLLDQDGSSYSVWVKETDVYAVGFSSAGTAPDYKHWKNGSIQQDPLGTPSSLILNGVVVN